MENDVVMIPNIMMTKISFYILMYMDGIHVN